jgi:hypothetical protein
MRGMTESEMGRVCVYALLFVLYRLTPSIRAIGSIYEPLPSFPCGASPSGVRLYVCVCVNLYNCACALEQVCVCMHLTCSYQFYDLPPPLSTANATTVTRRVMKSDDNSWLKLCVLGRLLGPHTHTHIYTHTHNHKRTNINTNTHTHTHAHTHTHTHTCGHTNTHTRTHIHTHTNTHTRTRIHW